MNAASTVFALLLAASTAGAVHAQGVLLLSGRSASEGRWEIGLNLPVRQSVDLETLVRRTRALAPADDSPVLWFLASSTALRLDDLPAEQRVAYYCLAPDTEQLAPGQVLFRPARKPLDPALWVAQEFGRVLWWPSAPQESDCGVAAALLASEPAQLDFGYVVLGQQAEVDLVLTNAGHVELQLYTISIEGEDFGLMQDGCSQLRLLPGQSCALRTGFAPSVSGERSGYLMAPSSAAFGLEQVSMVGQGLAPATLAVDPESLDFGEVMPGKEAQRALRLSNSGGAPLLLESLSINGAQFALAADACSQSNLPAGGECEVLVSFAPVASGPQSGKLIIPYGPDAPHEVDLRGNGSEVAPPDAIFASGFE